MSHIVYPIETRTELSEASKAAAAAIKKAIEQASSIGLKDQVTNLKLELFTVERSGLIVQGPLTNNECTIWRSWRSDRYTNAADVKSSDPRHMSHFSAGNLPPEVLAVWNQYLSSGVFDHLEIWTRSYTGEEQTVLVGVNGNVHHLIARWNYTANELPPFTEVLRTLNTDTLSSADLWGLMAVIVFAAFIVSLVLAAGITHELLISALLAAGAAYFAARKFYVYWRKGDVLLNAIDRYCAERNIKKQGLCAMIFGS